VTKEETVLPIRVGNFSLVLANLPVRKEMKLPALHTTAYGHKKHTRGNAKSDRRLSSVSDKHIASIFNA
jgi:hypothetical protein